MEGCSGCGCFQCTGRYCAQKVSIFAKLNEDQLKEVVNLIERKRYKKGDSIFSEGDVSDRLYIVNSGKVKVFKYTKEGKEQILYVLSEGDFVGELSLLKKDELEFNGEALEDTSFCIIRKDHFDALIAKYPEITLRIMEKLHDRIRSLESLIQNLSTKDVEARIARLLVSFAREFGMRQANGSVEIEMPLSREEIGNYVGLTRETVSRKLSVMQDSGILELVGSRRIIIKKIEELEEFL